MEWNLDILQQQVLWGVAVWRLGAAAVLIFFSFLGRKLIRHLFEGMLRRPTQATAAEWDDDLVELLSAPLALIAQVALLYAAASMLTLPLEPVNVRLFVYNGMKVALAVAATWVVFRLIDVVAQGLMRVTEETESKLDDQLVPLVRKTLKVFLAVTVGVMVVQNLGYSVTSLIASLGIGGLALALAAKDTVANFFGSLVVFTDQPFHVGDWVQFGDTEGVIEEVGFRTTRVRRFDKALVTVPNQMFTSLPIINYSRRDIRRIKLEVGLSYETTPEQMRAFIDRVKQMLGTHSGIDQGFHMVRFTGFEASSLTVLVYAFSNTAAWEAYLLIQEDVMLQIIDLVEEMGLEIAYPTRTLHLRQEEERPIPS